MNMCESYLTKTYSKISGASSFRCIGIAKCLYYNQESFTRVFRKDFGYLVKPCEDGPLVCNLVKLLFICTCVMC